MGDGDGCRDALGLRVFWRVRPVLRFYNRMYMSVNTWHYVQILSRHAVPPHVRYARVVGKAN